VQRTPFSSPFSSLGISSSNPTVTKIHLCRLQSVPPSQGDLFYLRALLQFHLARSFLELRTVDSPTYQQAATHLGLFADKNEAVYTLAEAVHAHGV
jgi:hypothetical protein